LRHSAERRLKELNKIINQFASSMKHLPFTNDLDKARALGFIKALRDVITFHGSKPVSKPKVYQVPEIREPVSNKEDSKKAIRKAKQTLRGMTDGTTNESASES